MTIPEFFIQYLPKLFFDFFTRITKLREGLRRPPKLRLELCHCSKTIFLIIEVKF